MKTAVTILITVMSFAAIPWALASDLDVPAVVIKDADTPATQSVPEPGSLIILAFAGVVILARHRFRPS